MVDKPTRAKGSLERGPSRYKVFKHAIRIAVPMLLLLCGLFTAIHIFHHSVTRNIALVRERSHIKVGLEAIRSDVQAATSDLSFLASSSHLKRVMRSRSVEARAQLANEFDSVLRAKKNYDQIRYLDEAGMEVVRVNYNSGMPLSVPEERLQNKAERYYFVDSLKLSRGTIFVSPMDLNVENGQIEKPHKPMLRFGTPVFDDQGRKAGVLVINYYADTIRHNIAQFLSNPNSSPMLLNRQGFWLLAPEPKDEWGFMFKNQRRFAGPYPKVWTEILRQRSGQFETADGLFTYLTIHPLQKEHTSSTGSPEAFAASTATVDDEGYFWVLLTHIPHARMKAQIYDHIQQGLLQLLLVSIIVMPLVWLFSRERVQRQWARGELERKEQYLRTITSQLAEGLLVVDIRGRIVTTNNEAELLLGWKSEELIGRNLHVVLSTFPANWRGEDHECMVVKAINQSVSQRKEHVNFTAKWGGLIPVSYAVAPYLFDGVAQGAIITFQDITKRLEMQAELKTMATHDPLTGVKNRGEIERLLHSEMKRSKRYGRRFAILMIDIDHFKQINDAHGHQIGDQILRAVCEIIDGQLRESDVLGRYGGEEFIVILPETTLPAAGVIGGRLRAHLAEQPTYPDPETEIRFTVSIGVAGFPECAETADKLIQVADQRLYQAKQNGRNCVVTRELGAQPISMADHR